MRALVFTVAAIAGVSIAVLSSNVKADVIVNASGSGWCNAGFAGACNNTNVTNIANTYASGRDQYQDWFAFNIPSDGQITSATINIWNDGSNALLDSVFNEYRLHQSLGFSYGLLTGGTLLGSTDVIAADTGISHYVSITLNSTALALLNLAEGANFVFGGGTSPNGGQIFGYIGSLGDGAPVPQLDLVFQGQADPNGDSVAVAEPTSLALFATGIAGIPLLRRRKRDKFL
jgi:hypothetical protein